MSDELELTPSAPGFRDRVTPKPPDPSQVFLLECPRVLKRDAHDKPEVVCKGVHFRHAGYVEHMLPYVKVGNEKKVSLESYQVKVCVKCKSAYIWIMDQLYDLSDKIDLKAWERTEKEAHAATGPGGQC